ncbi:hypothetical protein MNV49_001357 [Pseudohyphozyma bogoriensis]|nr:hypothetical protein MNV49_001357 [Pseudohyphozyma bogoriensis]
MAMDKEALQALIDASTTSKVRRPLPRAVVAVASASEILFDGASGVQFFSEDETVPSEGKASQDSVFWLASCTKLCTVIAALQLVEQGVIELDGLAEEWVPELKELKILVGFDADGNELWATPKSKITIRQLVTHTGGIKHAAPGEKLDIYRIKHGIDFLYGGGSSAPRASIVGIPLFTEPGAEFIYGSSNDWLGLVIQAASGLDLDDYFQKHIFQPLNITDMTFRRQPAHVAAQVNLTCWHPSYPMDRVNSLALSPLTCSGGAGLFGTARSFLKVLRTVLNRGEFADTSVRVLKSETVDLMFTPQIHNAAIKAQLNEYLEADHDPYSRSLATGGEGPVLRKERNWGLGGGLNIEGFEGGRGAGTLFWYGLGNTYWWIDRTKDITGLVFVGTMPWRAPGVFDLWAQLEPEIYRGTQ